MHCKKTLIFFISFLTAIALQQHAEATIEPSDIKMNADKVDFDYEQNISNFEGNVKISYQDLSLKSDSAKLFMTEKKASALGNVMLLYKNRVFFCDELEYNFQKKIGSMLNGSTYENIWIFKGEKINQVSKDEIHIFGANATLCQNSSPHQYMTAKKIILFPGKYLIAKHAIFWAGPLPIFYWPYYKRNLGQDTVFGIRLRHNEQFGFQVLTRYNFHSNDFMDSKFLLNWYENRGIGYGIQEKLFHDGGNGRIFGFYINDEEFEPNRSEEKAGELDRYRFTADHYHTFPNSVKSTLNLNYYSDSDLYDDYFPKEFDHNIQPDNRYKLNYASQDYSTSMTLRYNPNDFDNALLRLPQIDFNWYQHQINNSNFYFTSSNQAAYLQYDYANSLSEEPKAFRTYTKNTLDYSKKLFGWLTVNPKLTLDELWYSKSINNVLVTRTITTESTDPLTGEVTLVEETITENAEEEGSSIFRTEGKFSLSFSTNLFKVFERATPIWGYNKFRHVLTPTISYSYRPEPSKPDNEIIQFDENDRYGNESSTLGLSWISRWQAKKNNSKDTILYNRYSLSYDLKADKDPFGDFAFYSDVRISKNLKVDFQFRYDIEKSESEFFRTDLSWKLKDVFGFSLAYWHRNNSDNIVTPEISVNLGHNIFLRGYAYYNEEKDLFERTEISLIKSMHCMDFALQYNEKEYRDEQTIYFSISPKGISSRGLSSRGLDFFQ